MSTAKRLLLRCSSLAKATELGRYIRKVRVDWNVGIIEVARKAGISPTSMVDIEKGKRTAFRADVLLKVCEELHVPPSKLYSLAGINVDDDLRQRTKSIIRRIRMDRAQIESLREPDPLARFQEITGQVQEFFGLMCCCYTSKPAAATKESTELRKLISQCIRRGMWLAMVCPYPTVVSLTGNKAVLSEFYSKVLGSVRQLARDLKSEVGEAFCERIQLFTPNYEPALVFPPLQLVEYRPALLALRSRRSPRAVNDKFELGVWIRLGVAAADEWLEIDPTQGTAEVRATASETVQAWRGYFSEIIARWRPEQNSGWDFSRLNELSDWHLDSAG